MVPISYLTMIHTLRLAVFLTLEQHLVCCVSQIQPFFQTEELDRPLAHFIVLIIFFHYWLIIPTFVDQITKLIVLDLPHQQIWLQMHVEFVVETTQQEIVQAIVLEDVNLIILADVVFQKTKIVMDIAMETALLMH